MNRSKHGQAVAGLASNRSFLVAHALLRAASRLISTPKRRHECRRGTRGRVRYIIGGPQGHGDSLTVTARIFVLGLALAVGARAEPLLPPQLAGVGVVEQLGRKVDLGLTFVNSDGRVVKLGDFFHPGRPVILNLVYYSCPMLCTLVLNGQTSAMGKIPWTPGQEYEVVTISIDPTETSELARQKKAGYIEQLGRGGAGWHFLTDLDGHVKTLAEQVGFHYKYDEQIKQYAHQAAIMILTPGGAVSRYLYGIDFRPRDMRLALTEASEGRFSLSVDRLLLFCYHYDPLAHSYVPFAANVMRAGGVVAVLMLAVFLGALWRQERRTA